MNHIQYLDKQHTEKLKERNMTIPWYKMPIRLRGLPFNERKEALKAYEAHFGEYDWKSEICLDAYADKASPYADEVPTEVPDADKNNTV